MKLICPKCTKQAIRTHTQYGVRNSCCDLWSWGDNSPLVSGETHDARKQAHIAFDRIWQNKILSRTKAYAMLAEWMGLPARLCHIKLMTVEQATRVVSLSDDYMAQQLKQDQYEL
jgi:hypothetical protein